MHCGNAVSHSEGHWLAKKANAPPFFVELPSIKPLTFENKYIQKPIRKKLNEILTKSWQFQLKHIHRNHMCSERKPYTQALFTARVFIFGRRGGESRSTHTLSDTYIQIASQISHGDKDIFIGSRQTDWPTSNLHWQCGPFFFLSLPHLRVLLFKTAPGYRTAPQIPKAHCLAPNSHSPSVSHEQLMRSRPCLYWGEHIHPG